MKNRLIAGALIAFGAPFLASAACPAGQTPATILVGQQWTFRLTAARIGAIGNFTAFQNGYLSIVETVVDLTTNIVLDPLTGLWNLKASTFALNGNGISRMAPASGRWLVAPDCNSGQLQFMLNREFFTLNFTFNATKDTMTLTGRDESLLTAVVVPTSPRCPATVVPPETTSNGLPLPTPCPNATAPDPAALTGTARLNPLRACPPGLGNPLNLLKGTKYSYTLSGTNAFSESGNFIPSFLNPFAYSGDLTIENRIVNNGVVPAPTGNPPVQPNPNNNPGQFGPYTNATGRGIGLPFWPNYLTQGRYIIYPDCSGGELLFSANGFYVQLEFVFSAADFSQMYLLLDSPAARLGQIYAGIANKI